ncbi:hypothetical protein H7R52_16925 [Weissella confusa]|uniref:Uncharacterized protein n=1 Tax=Weissella confusa TaxID=1583 RepID=A0A923NJ83_WEICO|nr:hypothetical protein [Weissella confusa]
MILVMKNVQAAQQALAAATAAGLQNVYAHEERVGFATVSERNECGDAIGRVDSFN